MMPRFVSLGLVLSLIACAGDKGGDTGLTETGSVTTDTDTDTDTDLTTDTGVTSVETGTTDTGRTNWTYYPPTGDTAGAATGGTGDTGGQTVVIPPAVDSDGDGFGEDVDCDDNDPLKNPGADEVCDGFDNDCDGFVDDADGSLVSAGSNIRYFDRDGDGEGDVDSAFATCGEPFGSIAIGGDCNDSDPLVNTTATEVCDGVDNDCNGVSDDDDPNTDPSTFQVYFADLDGDGFGAADQPISQCHPAPNVVVDSTDCEDANAEVFPSAAEVCDGVDNDCDQLVDDDDQVLSAFLPLWYLDQDQDGFGVIEDVISQCATPAGRVLIAGDCDDQAAAISPGATEVCDGLDNDCDALIDDDDTVDLTGEVLFYPDQDGDGFGVTAGAVQRCSIADGWALVDQDCDDADAERNPGLPEICDGKDNNCNTDVDDSDPTMDPADIFTWYGDLDGDGFGDPNAPTNITQCARPPIAASIASNDGDCNDNLSAVNPAVPEVCDGRDQNCDDIIDNVEGDDGFVFYLDVDGDGFGGPIEVISCAAPEDGVIDGGDCDDTDAARFPGNEEICNGFDDDCDELVDADDDHIPSASFYEDLDGDGFGAIDSLVVDCDNQPANTIDVGGDCDDADVTFSPDAVEVSGDGLDQNCDGYDDMRTLAVVGPNSFRLSEVMVDPSKVDAELGQWIEFRYSLTQAPLNLVGLELHSGTNTYVFGDAIVEPSGYFVIGGSEEFVLNGGAPVDLAWENFTIDATQVLSIEYAGNVLATFDPVALGVEQGLAYQASSLGWCLAPTPYGLGDWGTPGFVNPGC